MDITKLVTSTYNKIAGKYTAGNASDESNFPYTDKLLSYLHKQAKILDVGSGPGILTQYVLNKGYQAEGIDTSKEMIKIAREKVPGGTFTVMDMRHTSYNDSAFDAIIAAYSLIHIPSSEIPNTLKEFNRILKPEGTLLIVVQKGEADQLVPEPLDADQQTFVNFFTLERLNNFLKAQNFTITEQEEMQTDDPCPFKKSDTVIFTIARKLANSI